MTTVLSFSSLVDPQDSHYRYKMPALEIKIEVSTYDRATSRPDMRDDDREQPR